MTQYKHGKYPFLIGQYDLFFAIVSYEMSWKYLITFVPTNQVHSAEIIRADQELSPPEHLLMDAEAV